jgi:hypothetical protein
MNSLLMSLDIGHSTGLYMGLLRATEEPCLLSTLHLTLEGLPEEGLQQKSLISKLSTVSVLLLEYPVLNRMSTMQKETKEATNWWIEFTKEHYTGLKVILQPSMWKPMRRTAPQELLFQTKPTQHEIDAAHMAWYYARWYSKKS